ncbi:hypothetical protein HanRHA438_Chr17g0801581 [Helianthus annuus]|nr:hypothetical protein HanRHA438_Chr17g0801581 [Helianthus annuus]
MEVCRRYVCDGNISCGIFVDSEDMYVSALCSDRLLFYSLNVVSVSADQKTLYCLFYGSR